MQLLFLHVILGSQLVLDGIRNINRAEFTGLHSDDTLIHLKLDNKTFDLKLTPINFHPIIQFEYLNRTALHKNTFKVYDVDVLFQNLQIGVGRLTQTNLIYEGRILTTEGTFIIKQRSVYLRSRKSDDVYPPQKFEFISYKEEELVDLSGAPSCNSHNLPYNKIIQGKKPYFLRLSKRDVPQGCPQDKKVLYLGASTDCTYARLLDNDQSQIVQQLISNFAQASSIYERTFNVGLGLFKVNIKMECGPGTDSSTWNQDCSDNYDITQRLSDFSSWRATNGGNDAGLWHLGNIILI
eukprot:NODE_33_length_36935_cov_1.609241.p15 type:complete len:295 gc:universal NODE_33_length_36935_cov_1.609241:4553-3669(-)